MTADKRVTITMSERRPITIAAADWPRIAYGQDFSGEHECQAFDGVWIAVREHKDGRSIVYGYAGDWDGGGRTGREDRSAGYLLPKGEDVVRAVHRVAGILAGTGCVGEMAHTAARRCIADLPAEELDTTEVQS
jgi:hypothetical protein